MLAGVAKIDVVGPTSANGVTDAVEEALERGDGSDDPIADEGDLAAVWRAGVDGAAKLNGQGYRLCEQDRDEDEDVLIACKERFHSLKMIICEIASEWEGEVAALTRIAVDSVGPIRT